MTSFSVGDYVLIENHERDQTKLDSKYKRPYEIIEILDDDRYHLKTRNSNRYSYYKYSKDRLRPLPNLIFMAGMAFPNLICMATELDTCLSDDNNGNIFVLDLEIKNY